LPLIASEFPEVADCHRGTINVQFQLPLWVAVPDYRTSAIHWDDVHHPNGEVFDLVRIIFEAPIGESGVDAWLYVPHNSDHRKTPRVHEVIAPKLTIPTTTQCRITIRRQVAELPYLFAPALVVI
jgi:hypothetical protein